MVLLFNALILLNTLILMKFTCDIAMYARQIGGILMNCEFPLGA